MVSQLAPAEQTVTLVKNDDTPDSRFQIIACGSTDTAPRLVKAFAIQGDAVSWLLCNGYKWVPDCNSPQQWVKE
jgi:hypothetical protein